MKLEFDVEDRFAAALVPAIERYIKIFQIEHGGENPINSRCTSLFCKKCGNKPNEFGQDDCIQHLGHVTNACCGHGGEGYIQFDNGITVRGKFRIEKESI